MIDLDVIDPDLLPDESAVAAVALAELAVGPHATRDEEERARRQGRLQWAATTWEALPFATGGARMYGRIFSAIRATGRSSRSRLADLLITTAAAANGPPLYTRNQADSAELEHLVDVKRFDLRF